MRNANQGNADKTYCIESTHIQIIKYIYYNYISYLLPPPQDIRGPDHDESTKTTTTTTSTRLPNPSNCIDPFLFRSSTTLNSFSLSSSSLVDLFCTALFYVFCSKINIINIMNLLPKQACKNYNCVKVPVYSKASFTNRYRLRLRLALPSLIKLFMTPASRQGRHNQTKYSKSYFKHKKLGNSRTQLTNLSGIPFLSKAIVINPLPSIRSRKVPAYSDAPALRPSCEPSKFFNTSVNSKKVADQKLQYRYRQENQGTYKDCIIIKNKGTIKTRNHCKLNLSTLFCKVLKPRPHKRQVKGGKVQTQVEIPNINTLTSNDQKLKEVTSSPLKYKHLQFP